MPDSFILFDSNSLRNKARVDDLVGANDLSILILDTLIYESAAVKNAPYTFWRNFEHLVKYSDRCFMAFDLSDLMKAERSNCRPVTTIVDLECTNELRSMLKKLPLSSDSDVTAFLTRLTTEGLSEKAIREKDGRAKGQLLKMIEAIKEDFSSEEQKTLRANPTDEITRHMSSIGSSNTIYKLLTGIGHSEKAALDLCSSPSITMTYCHTLMTMALYWFAYQGYESRKPEKFQNDFFDLEYIAFATLLDCQLISVDGNQQKISLLAKESFKNRTRLFEHIALSATP